MQWRRLLKVVAPALAAFLSGCDVAGTVVDRSNTETQVMNMRVAGVGTLKMVHGAAVKEVPLEAFESLTLYPEETRTIEGELCFGADVTMRDGTRFSGRDKANNNKPRTYVCVTRTLLGTSHRGEFRIELSGVSKITFR
jgi:hypothetical protein